MNELSEKNARQNRQLAFWLTLTLHVALGTALYLQTSEKPQKSEKSAPVAAAKPTTKKLITP